MVYLFNNADHGQGHLTMNSYDLKTSHHETVLASPHGVNTRGIWMDLASVHDLKILDSDGFSGH